MPFNLLIIKQLFRWTFWHCRSEKKLFKARLTSVHRKIPAYLLSTTVTLPNHIHVINTACVEDLLRTMIYITNGCTLETRAATHGLHTMFLRPLFLLDPGRPSRD